MKINILKLRLYKFLGIFIPYFKRKFMKIDYYIRNWGHFLQNKTYDYNAVPRVGEKVVLFINEAITVYTVIEVKYVSSSIKILIE